MAQQALADLVTALDQTIAELEQAKGRAQRLQQRWSGETGLLDAVQAEPGPLVVELLTSSIDRLADAGSRWRRAEARVLHEEGASMTRIAQLFGVSRQRISALLRPPPAARG